MQPFNWIKNGQQHVACETLDVSSGIEIVLQMIEKDLLAMETDDDTYLSVMQRAALLRLAITSSKMLANRAEQEIMRINVSPSA